MMRVNARAAYIPDEVRFTRFVAARGGVMSRRDAPETFGNLVLETELDGYRVRFICDRGDESVYIGDESRWHGPRNLLGMIDGLSPQEIAKQNEPSLDRIIGRWDDLLRAIADPALPAFETAIGHAVMDRLSRESGPIAAGGVFQVADR